MINYTKGVFVWDQSRIRIIGRNNASKRLFGSYFHSGIPGFHSGYSAPRSRIAEEQNSAPRSRIARIYSGIHSYSGIFPNERALNYPRFFRSFMFSFLSEYLGFTLLVAGRNPWFLTIVTALILHVHVSFFSFFLLCSNYIDSENVQQ